MRTVFLTGPKHSGKTSAGKALAALLSCGFVDLDELIAERSGKSPRELYVEGPQAFQRAEADALASLAASVAVSPDGPPLVVAAGGGIIDNPCALSLLEQDEPMLTVFLDVSAGTAWERVSRGGELPPFLKTANPQETHRSLHERRAAAYRKAAQITIEAEGKTPEAIAREINARILESFGAF